MLARCENVVQESRLSAQRYYVDPARTGFDLVDMGQSCSWTGYVRKPWRMFQELGIKTMTEAHEHNDSILHDFEQLFAEEWTLDDVKLCGEVCLGGRGKTIWFRDQQVGFARMTSRESSRNPSKARHSPIERFVDVDRTFARHGIANNSVAVELIAARARCCSELRTLPRCATTLAPKSLPQHSLQGCGVGAGQDRRSSRQTGSRLLDDIHRHP